MRVTTASVLAPRLQRPAAVMEFLPAALEIIDTPASPAARYTALTIGGFFVIALTWSIVGKVDIIASAPGVLIPAGKSKVVQPFDAGIVKDILVADGDHVTPGQPLLELDSTQVGSEQSRIQSDMRQARLDVAGLRALRASVSKVGEVQAMTKLPDLPAADLDMERAAMLARAQEQAEKIGSLLQEITAKQAENAENTAAISRLTSSLPYLLRKRDMYRKLMRNDLAPVPAWADAEQVAAEQEQQILVLGKHAESISAQQAAITREVAEARATYVRDLLKDLASAEQRLDETSAEFEAAVGRSRNTTLKAPVAGIVQQLGTHTIGGVVTPAQQIMVIVPDKPLVVVEAIIENKDVGFVHVGDEAEVKVNTFTFTRFGLIRGRVTELSRDSVISSAPFFGSNTTSERGRSNSDASIVEPTPQAGYIAHISLSSDYILVDGKREPLLPGMEVTAEIKTGRRSVLDYLASPVTQHVTEAGHER